MYYPTQDPKYGIDEGRLVNASTGEPIPAGEPIFIFRAKDKHLPAVLAEYVLMCENESHANAVEQREVEIGCWQERNANRLKEPDTEADQ